MLSPLQAIKRQRQTDGVKEEEVEGGGSSGVSSNNNADSNAQDEGGDNASGMREAAERILTRIRQKLQG